MGYEPTLAIWAVGRHQRLAARAIQHATVCLAEINYDYLLEPSVKRFPRLLKSPIVYKDESRILCDGDQRTCHVAENKWRDLRSTYDIGYGDCKCLVAIRLAECWQDGREAYPLARCFKCKTVRFCKTCERPLGNGQTWHMQLVHGDGRVEDISRWLGMRPHPDGDDAVVDAFDQVGMVRLHPGDESGDPMNRYGSSIGAAAMATAAAAMIAAAGPPREKQLPAWVLNMARDRAISPSGHVLDGICAPTDLSPNPKGGPALAQVASSLEFRWCVGLRRGDSAGNIAERITGDRSRRIEIIAANPTLPTVPRSEVDGGIDFAPGALRVGERVHMPRTFAPWIDQMGMPRFADTGQRRPYPPYDRMPEGWRPV